MTGMTITRRGLWLALPLTLALLAVTCAEPQYQLPKQKPEMIKAPLQPGQSKVQTTGIKVIPRLEPIAETRLIMEGVAHTNFRGLERLLTARPNEDKAWQFARGQALLLAETANLLMLRPPKNQGQAVWFEKSMALRDAAKDLAVLVGTHNFAAEPASSRSAPSATVATRAFASTWT